MSQRYTVVSGVVFGFIAVVQAARAFNRLPVRVGNFDVPVSISWIAAVVAGGLCFWAFKSRS